MKKDSFFAKHPIVLQLIWMALISLAIIILVFFGIRIYSRHGKVYDLPNMVGQSVDSLQHDNDLSLSFVVLDSTYRDGKAGGLILTQDPKPGTVIKKGRKIYVTVTAYNPSDAIVPDITGGLTLRTAISQLESVGLVGGTLKFVDSPFRNNIIEMTYNGKIVNAGEKLTNGAKIDLVVGLGDDPSKTVSTVPFVIGKKASRARHEILSASFNVGAEHYDGVSDRRTAVVYKQQPAYDGMTQLPFGTRVNLWYCDADEQKIHKMVEEYRVDSSAIGDPASIGTVEWGSEQPFEDEGLDW